ncbi:MAG TPA: MHYT domain-containing protein [Vineibacter sp.]|nr:MHYT domain-containing protein [Vineibacter sp.]
MDLGSFFTVGRDLTQALPDRYNYGLVVLSYAIAALGSFAFLQFADRIVELRGSVLRVGWLVGGAVTMGSGIWAMHFVAMLAYVLPIPVSYDPVVTIVSMLPAMLAAGVALHIVARPAVTTSHLLTGGTLMGIGIGTMHYTGMSAVQLQALVRYDPLLFAMSLVAAVLLAIIALQVRVWVGQAGTRRSPTLQAAAGALILGLAVTAMHYTAMASTYCFARATTPSEAMGLSPSAFAGIVALIAAMMLIMAIAAVIFDRRVKTEIALRQEATAREKKATEQLLRAQKLEAVGQLTGGIAHDFNNILAIIGVKLEGIEDELPPDSPLRGKIASAQSAVQRGAGLVERLLTFARRRKHLPLETDIAIQLRSLGGLLTAAVPRTIALVMSIPESLHACMIDRSEFDNALLNLVVNARDAMPSGGEILIAACNRSLPAGDATLPPGISPGTWVEVSVRDNGVGMPPEMQDRIFEPFFTTKNDGKGSGLGLAMVHGFVHQSGGFVRVNSAVGEGTTVMLFLPAMGPATGAMSAGGGLPTTAPFGVATSALRANMVSLG